MKNLYIILVAASLLLLFCGTAFASDKDDIRSQIDAYVNSIMHADDISLAEKVWATGPESSLIHPRGHERGWGDIQRNFYTKTMAQTFSKRDLKLADEPVIHIYGDSAVVEFEWNFTATMRSNGETRKTTGRESQVFIKTPDGWRLVHVHYSGPANR